MKIYSDKDIYIEREREVTAKPKKQTIGTFASAYEDSLCRYIDIYRYIYICII